MKRIKKSKNATVTLLLCAFSMLIVLMLSIVYATFSTNLSISEKGKIRSLPKGIYYYRESGADIGYFYTDGSLANAMTINSKETGETEKISTLHDFAKAINQKTNLYMVSTYKETSNYQMDVVFSNDIDIYGYNIDGKSSYEKDSESNEGALGYLFRISADSRTDYNIIADNSKVIIHSQDAADTASNNIFDIFLSDHAKVVLKNVDVINNNKSSYSNLFHGCNRSDNTNIYGNLCIIAKDQCVISNSVIIHDFNDSKIKEKGGKLRNFLSSDEKVNFYLGGVAVDESSDINFSSSIISVYNDSYIEIQSKEIITSCAKYSNIKESPTFRAGIAGDILISDKDDVAFISELINTTKSTSANDAGTIMWGGHFEIGSETYPVSIEKGNYVNVSDGYGGIEEGSKIYVESKDEETLNSGGSVLIAKASSVTYATEITKYFSPKSDKYEIVASGNSIVIKYKAAYYYRESGSDTGYFYTDKNLNQVMTNSSGEKISTLTQFAKTLTSEMNLYMVSTYIEDFTNSSSSVNFSYNLNVYGYNISGKSSYEKDNSDTLGYLFKIYKTKVNKNVSYGINATNNAILKFYSKDVNSEDIFDIFLSSEYESAFDLTSGKKQFINTVKTKYSDAIRGCTSFKNCDLYGNFYLSPKGTFDSYNNLTFHDFDDTNVTNKRTDVISSPSGSYGGLYIGDVKVEESTCTFSAKDFSFMSALNSHFEIQHRNILDTVIKYGLKMQSDVYTWGCIYGMDLTTGNPYYKSVTVADEINLISKIISTSSDNRFTSGTYKIGSAKNPIVISKNKPLKIHAMNSSSKIYIKSNCETELNAGEEVNIVTSTWSNKSMSDVIGCFVCTNDGCELKVVSGNYIAVVKKTSSSGASTASVLNSQQKDNKNNKNDEETDTEESSTIKSSGNDPPADS